MFAMPNITRRDWLRLPAAAAARPLFARPARPNIVVLLADDLGYGDLTSYGAPDIRTPNIDGIGRRGVRFTQFYANGPECSPTRTGLMTGRYQHRVGGLECAIGVGNVGRYDEAEWLAGRGELGLPTSEFTMPRALKDAGYDTACFGKWHLGYGPRFSPNAHGFDEYLGILGGNSDYFKHVEEGGAHVLYHNGKEIHRDGQYTTDMFAAEAIRWLKSRGSKPFFLYLPFNAPHTPIQDPDEFDPKTGTAPVRQHVRRVYAKMVEREDRRIGDVLAQLDSMRAANNTLVIFMSDNGGDGNGYNTPLRGRKGTTWEGGIRVPCQMRWPGVLPEGKITSQVSISMDMLPTIMAACGITPPAGRSFDGTDIMPVLRGARKPFARTLFWRGRRALNIRKAVRDGDMKLVDDNGKQEVHNLAADLTESRNLLPGAEQAAERLRAKLAAWEREVRSPRLRDFPGKKKT